jgi:MFS family permease
MEEARRFLRYVMPGLVYGVLTALWLFILLPEWTQSQMRYLAAKDSIGIAFGGLFASGVLGYIFATAHHWWHWHVDKGILDHQPLINRLVVGGLISNQPRDNTFTRVEALELSLALWYQRVRHDGLIADAANKKVTSLGDHAHGLGAARVASSFALITALLVSFAIGTFRLQCEPMIRFALMLLLAVGVVYLFHDAYRRVGKIAQGIYDTVLQNTLSGEHKPAA